MTGSVSSVLTAERFSVLMPMAVWSRLPLGWSHASINRKMMFGNSGEGDQCLFKFVDRVARNASNPRTRTGSKSCLHSMFFQHAEHPVIHVGHQYIVVSSGPDCRVQCSEMFDLRVTSAKAPILLGSTEFSECRRLKHNLKRETGMTDLWGRRSPGR